MASASIGNSVVSSRLRFQAMKPIVMEAPHGVRPAGGPRRASTTLPQHRLGHVGSLLRSRTSRLESGPATMGGARLERATSCL